MRHILMFLGLLTSIMVSAQTRSVVTDKVKASTSIQLGANTVTEFDQDTILAANSHGRLPTQKAVKTYVDNVAATLGGQVDTFYVSNDTVYLQLENDDLKYAVIPNLGVYVTGPLTGSGTTFFPLDIALESLDSTRIKNGGVSVKDIGQHGASTGQVLKWTGGQWAPGADGVGVPAGSTGEVQFNNAGAFGASSNLTWDAVLNRFSIGTNTHTAGQFHLTGTQTAGSTLDFAAINISTTLTPNGGTSKFQAGINVAPTFSTASGTNPIAYGIRVSPTHISGYSAYAGIVINSSSLYSGFGSAGLVIGCSNSNGLYINGSSSRGLAELVVSNATTPGLVVLSNSANNPLMFSLGKASTTVGDYVNAIFGVRPSGQGAQSIGAEIRTEMTVNNGGNSKNAMIFARYSNSVRTENGRWSDDGFWLVNTTSEHATTTIKGFGTTSSDFTLLATNSSGTTATAGLSLNGAEQLSTGTNAPNASAQFEVASTTKGALLAPMTRTHRNAISSPAEGLLVFDNIQNAYSYYDSARWVYVEKLLQPATATLDFPSTAAGECQELTVTVTGAADGDFADVAAPNASWPDRGQFSARVSAADTVTVRFCNNDLTNAKDPASGTFRVKVSKF